MQILEYITENLNHLVEVGGVYIYPLLFLAILLWYTLGYRFHLLKRGKKLTVSQLIDDAISNKKLKPKGIIDGAIYEVLKRVENSQIKTEKSLENIIDEILINYHANIKSYSNLVKALTISAPILGLLGTVDGMITMFNSLVSSSFYSYGGGGIAGGISKALYTTELGLIIGTPGLILGNLLNSKQKKIEEELMEVRYFLLEKLKKEVENEKV